MPRTGSCTRMGALWSHDPMRVLRLTIKGMADCPSLASTGNCISALRLAACLRFGGQVEHQLPCSRANRRGGTACWTLVLPGSSPYRGDRARLPSRALGRFSTRQICTKCATRCQRLIALAPCPGFFADSSLAAGQVRLDTSIVSSYLLRGHDGCRRLLQHQYGFAGRLLCADRCHSSRRGLNGRSRWRKTRRLSTRRKLKCADS